MSVLIRATVLAAAIGAVACGQTTKTTPVYTPPSRGGVSTTAPTGPAEANASPQGVVPAGQELDVRLQRRLNSGTAQVEQRFEATTVVDLTQNGRVLIPAGSTVDGVVSGVKPAGRVDRTGSLTLSFERIQIRGRDYPMHGMATQIFESGGIREEVGTVGAGAGVGGVIGGILGGVKGAILGAVIGAGGVIAATEGKDVDLPAGAIIRIRLDSPIDTR
jgi:hypothetical protein